MIFVIRRGSIFGGAAFTWLAEDLTTPVAAFTATVYDGGSGRPSDPRAIERSPSACPPAEMTIWDAPATLRDVDGWPALMTGETPVAGDDICTQAAISANRLGEEANRWRVGFNEGARVGFAEGWTMPANGLVNGVTAYCAAQAAECLMHESSAVIILGKCCCQTVLYAVASSSYQMPRISFPLLRCSEILNVPVVILNVSATFVPKDSVSHRWEGLCSGDQRVCKGTCLSASFHEISRHSLQLQQLFLSGMS